MPILGGTPPKNTWTDLVYDWLTKKGEDVSDTVGDFLAEKGDQIIPPATRKAFTRWEGDQLAKGVDLLGGPESETFKKVTGAVEPVGRAMETILDASGGGGQPLMGGVFKVAARGSGTGRVVKALEKVGKKLSPKTPGGQSALKAIKKQVEHPKTQLIEDPALKHLGEWRRPIHPKTERPFGKAGQGKLSLRTDADIATDFHEIAHIAWDDLGDAQRASFITASESGHIPLHGRMVQKGKPYLKDTTYNQLMGENYAHWKSDWLNDTLSPTAAQDRNVIAWFEETMGQPGPNPTWLADHQKALSVKDVEKAFFQR